MKNQIKFLLITLLFISSSNFVLAQTDDYGEIEDKFYCPKLTQLLVRGDSDVSKNGEVSELQKFLSDYFDTNLQGGFFGSQTQKAVLNFQTKNSLPSFGRVGTLTRNKISEVCNYSSDLNSENILNNKNINTNNLNCKLGNRTILNNKSILSYASGAVEAGKNCVWEFRACKNGNLSGSYQYLSCKILPRVCDPKVPETRTVGCPSGQVGTIVETRISSCLSQNSLPTWSNWNITTNTCVSVTQPVEPPIVINPVPKRSCQYRGNNYPDGYTTTFFFSGALHNTPIQFSQMTMGAPDQTGTQNLNVACAVGCGGPIRVPTYKCVDGEWIRQSTDSYYNNYPIVLKPVIYLYPEKTQKIKVQLKYSGEFATTYPDYNKVIGGWEVIAKPDGTLTNLADNQEYSYLFWEGKNYPLTVNEKFGFVISGKDTKNFLQNKLKELGLTPKEYNEFIVFWLPRMENNKYNFVQFVGKEYTDLAPLETTPKPDSVLRVFMAFKPLDTWREVQEQKLEPFKRKGFAVIEWGGMELEK